MSLCERVHQRFIELMLGNDWFVLYADSPSADFDETGGRPYHELYREHGLRRAPYLLPERIALFRDALLVQEEDEVVPEKETGVQHKQRLKERQAQRGLRDEGRSNQATGSARAQDSKSKDSGMGTGRGSQLTLTSAPAGSPGTGMVNGAMGGGTGIATPSQRVLLRGGGGGRGRGSHSSSPPDAAFSDHPFSRAVARLQPATSHSQGTRPRSSPSPGPSATMGSASSSSSSPSTLLSSSASGGSPAIATRAQPKRGVLAPPAPTRQPAVSSPARAGGEHVMETIDSESSQVQGSGGSDGVVEKSLVLASADRGAWKQEVEATKKRLQ